MELGKNRNTLLRPRNLALLLALGTASCGGAEVNSTSTDRAQAPGAKTERVDASATQNTENGSPSVGVSSDIETDSDAGVNTDEDPEVHKKNILTALCNTKQEFIFYPQKEESVEAATLEYLDGFRDQFDQLGLGGGLTPEGIASVVSSAKVTVNGENSTYDATVAAGSTVEVNFDPSCLAEGDNSR